LVKRGGRAKKKKREKSRRGVGGGRDWVSSDCVSGQLHMFLIKILTLRDQLHAGMLVVVIRPNVLWSGGSPENTQGPLQDHLLGSAVTSHACAPQRGQRTLQ